MSSFIDYIMLGLFVLFMFFIFGGYHQNKFEGREQKRLDDEKREDEKNSETEK